jgi:hypothetical protein
LCPPQHNIRRTQIEPLEVVSKETLKYGREFCGFSTQESLFWQGPEAIVHVNYRPVLSSERALHIKKPQSSDRKQKSGYVLQMGA